jgi:tetratricopeptide (TPR) repeat protein
MTQAGRARQEAALAQRERDAALDALKFSQASEAFMRFLLSEGSNRPSTTAELLARADEAVDRQFAGDAALRARMQMLVAELFIGLRDLRNAAAVLERAAVSAQASQVVPLQARVECLQGGLNVYAGQPEQAEARIEAGLRRLQGSDDAAARVLCLSQRASMHRRLGRIEAMLADTREALEHLGRPHGGQMSDYLQLQSQLADAASQQGPQRDGAAIYEQVIATLERSGLDRTAGTLVLFNNYATLLRRAGQWKQALAAHQRGLASASAPDGPRNAAMSVNHARLLADLGRVDEALPMFEQVRVAVERSGDRQSEAFMQLALAAVRCARPGDPACEAAIDAALALIDAERDATDRAAGRARIGPLLARALVLLGEIDAAAQHAGQAIEDARFLSGGYEHSEWLGHAGAQATWREALAHYEASVGTEAPQVHEVRALLGPR